MRQWLWEVMETVGEEVDRVLFQHLSGSTEVNCSKLGQTEWHCENSELIRWNPKIKLFRNIALQPLQAVRQQVPMSFLWCSFLQVTERQMWRWLKFDADIFLHISETSSKFEKSEWIASSQCLVYFWCYTL